MLDYKGFTRALSQTVFAMVVGVLGMSSLQAAVLSSTVDEKVVSADLVFEGYVVDVQTRFSERASESDPLVPYRFVTYQVNRILKGNYQGNTVTLRFLGGEAEDGQVLLMAGQPLFDVGDHDLMMVKGNNRYPCPLVECAQGRFRYLGGMVVNELGQRLYLDANGQIIMGEHIENEELTTNQLSENVTIETHEVHEMGHDEIPNMAEQYPDATTADPGNFAENMDQKIRQNLTDEQLANLPPFEDADPDAPFVDETYERPGFAVGMPPMFDAGEENSMPEDERLEREQEQAMLAKLEAMNADPARKAELKALNDLMEKKHPGVYVEDAGVVISSATAATAEVGHHHDHGTTEATSNRWGWGVAALVLLVIGGAWGWNRKRRASTL